MSQFDIEKLPKGPKGFMYDWGSDQRAFKGVPWGKAMMWIFLVARFRNDIIISRRSDKA